MTATTEQLLAIIRDAADFIDHTAICDVVTKFGSISPYPSCTCGMRLLMVRVEEALANHPERPESSTGDDDGN